MIIGIDCGYRTGGVALVAEDWAEVHDLPVFTEGGVNVVALMEIITSVEKVDHIYIEKQQAMPKQGVSSTFKLGYAFGQIVTTCALSRSPYTLVTPNNWKRSLNLPKDKDAARRLASQWFPDLASELKRKKDEHRAEALLIALFGRGK
jgi:crossover junction endodeoxyribonuclease RuvC